MTDATQDLKRSAEVLTEKAEILTTKKAQDAQQVTEAVAEVAKEAAKDAGQTVATASDYTLQLLGITVDTRTLIENSASFAIKVVLAMVIFYVGKWIGRHIVELAKRAMIRSSMDATAVSFLTNLLYGIVLAAVVLASLNQLGISTTSFVAVLGALTVAIGVSLKDQVSNLAAGVLIVIFRPFRRGDMVEVGGRTGTVLEITLVNTRIQTPNNHEVIIPNGDIMTSASVNYSSLPNRRVDVLVGISYDSDIKVARQIMIDLAKAHELILKEPEPIVRVTALAESSVDLTLYVWTDNTNWVNVQSDLLESIKYAFDEAGVGIPFPNRTLQIANLNEMMGELKSHLTQKDIGKSEQASQ